MGGNIILIMKINSWSDGVFLVFQNNALLYLHEYVIGENKNIVKKLSIAISRMIPLAVSFTGISNRGGSILVTIRINMWTNC